MQQSHSIRSFHRLKDVDFASTRGSRGGGAHGGGLLRLERAPICERGMGAQHSIFGVYTLSSGDHLQGREFQEGVGGRGGGRGRGDGRVLLRWIFLSGIAKE